MSDLMEHTARSERAREAKPDLQEELRGWGFRGSSSGEYHLSEDGSQLIFDDGYGEEYVVAESTYYGADTDPLRPFLAVVLDAMRLAAKDVQHG